MVLERIAEFLRALLDRHDQHHADLKQDNSAMTATLASILDKVTTQGQQIDQLVAARDAKEQADLEQINALLDANGVKVAAALAPAADASTTLTVAAQVAAGSLSIPITAGTAPELGSTVTGPGIADGTTVAPGTTASVLSIDNRPPTITPVAKP